MEQSLLGEAHGPAGRSGVITGLREREAFPFYPDRNLFAKEQCAGHTILKSNDTNFWKPAICISSVK